MEEKHLKILCGLFLAGLVIYVITRKNPKIAASVIKAANEAGAAVRQITEEVANGAANAATTVAAAAGAV